MADTTNADVKGLPFEKALAYLTGHDKVWRTTGREIAQHFLANHCDDFARASEPVGEAP